MSTFNTLVKEQSKALNHEGAEAFRLSAEMELYTAVVTASLGDKFYETASERIERIAGLVGKCDAQFVAKLAVYARQKMNLRSVPLLLVVELAKTHKGDDLVSRTVEKVIMRADEIMELLHCYQWRNQDNAVDCYLWSKQDRAFKKTGYKKKLCNLSHQIQVGLQKAFNKFDEYQFAKYDRDNLDVKLRDALFIAHPKAKDQAQQEIFDKIVNKSLETPYTWETQLSALGQQQFDTKKDRKQALTKLWEELIDSGKLGYMALLRNLRNMLDNDVSIDKIESVAARLADEKEVLHSKQLPFRFLSAYKKISGTTPYSHMKWNAHEGIEQTKEKTEEQKQAEEKENHIIEALEKAVLASAQNIAGFDENTRVLIASDVSSSMYLPISMKSTINNYDIGLMLSMILNNRCKNVVSGIFGDTWKVVNMPSTGILHNVGELYKREGEVGYSTNGYKVIEYLRENNIVMDKVMMFTDCQMWDSDECKESIHEEWDKYKQIAPDAKLYLFDLVGYGNTPLDIVRDDVFLIAGWSDCIFEMLHALEKGSSVIEEIRKIKL